MEIKREEGIIGSECAAICGLFCGTCPSHMRGQCGGCLSERCDCECMNDFKDCAEEMGVTRCFECEKFPCDELESFSTRHIENGICHHEHVIEDLKLMKEVGVDKWVADKTAENTCKVCGLMIAWHNKKCPCGNGMKK